MRLLRPFANIARMSHTLTEIARKLANLIGLGTIAQADHSSARVKVDINGRVTDWLPIPADIGNNFIRWRPLRVGTQVLVACPGGDPANAIIVQILYSAALSPPANRGDVDIIAFDDGTTLEYDTGAKRLTVKATDRLTVETGGNTEVTVGGNASIEVAGPLDITSATTVSVSAPSVGISGTNGSASTANLVGNFAMIGNLDVTGHITATGTIIDAGGNSANHTH